MVWLASRDPRTPIAAKAIAVLTIGYALSPIDLIPDFIPVLGLLDDILLIPAGVWLVLRLLPKGLLAELREKAVQTPWPVTPSWAVALIGATWLLLAGGICWFVLRG